QNRILNSQRSCEARIRLERVDIRSKVSNAETPQLGTARPERFALGRSTAGERLGKPREHDRLTPSEIAEPINTPVGTRQREIGRLVARLEGNSRVATTPGRHVDRARDRRRCGGRN